MYSQQEQHSSMMHHHQQQQEATSSSSSSSSSFSTTLSKVAVLNNKAISFFQHGEYANAIVLLSQAIFSLRTHEEEQQQNQLQEQAAYDDDDNSMDESDDEDDILLPSLEFVTSQRPRSSFFLDVSSKRCSSWYLYQEALLLNTTTTTSTAFDNNASTSSRQQASEIISYAVIYNLALCHHLDALSSSPPAKTSSPQKQLHPNQPVAVDTTKLERAVLFYNHAQYLLNDTVGAAGTNSASGTMIYSLAITNNLGHVHRCLDDTVAAKEYFQRLLNAIMYLSSDATICEESRSFLSKHDLCFQGFLTNALTLLVASSLPAAAA